MTWLWIGNARPEHARAVVALDRATAHSAWPADRLRAACEAGADVDVPGDAPADAPAGAPGHVLVASVDGSPLGFLLYSQVLDEVSILKLAVDPGHRRRGIARELLDHLRALAADGHVRRLLLEVSVANRPALGLYDGAGFTVDGRRPGYYSGDSEPEDALLMSLSLGDAR